MSETLALPDPQGACGFRRLVVLGRHGCRSHGVLSAALSICVCLRSLPGP